MGQETLTGHTSKVGKLLFQAAVQVSRSSQECSQAGWENAQQRCLPTVHILWERNATTGMDSCTPVDIWLCSANAEPLGCTLTMNCVAKERCSGSVAIGFIMSGLCFFDHQKIGQTMQVDARSTCAHSSHEGYGLKSRGLEEGVKVLPVQKVAYFTAPLPCLLWEGFSGPRARPPLGLQASSIYLYTFYCHLHLSVTLKINKTFEIQLAPWLSLNLYCSLMLFNDQAIFPLSRGLVRSALAGLNSFLWHLLEQWTHGRQPMGRRSIPNSVPMCSQLGPGTADLLNWRKMVLYLACAHHCPLHMHGLN